MMNNNAVELAVQMMKNLSLGEHIIGQFKSGITCKSVDERVFPIKARMEQKIIKELEGWGQLVFHVVPSILLIDNAIPMESTAYLSVPMDIGHEIGLDDLNFSKRKREKAIRDFVMERLGASKFGQVFSFVVNDAWGVREFGDIITRPNGNGGLKRIG